MNSEEFAPRWRHHAHAVGSTAWEALLWGVIRYAERAPPVRPAAQIFRKLVGDEHAIVPERLVEHDRRRESQAGVDDKPESARFQEKRPTRDQLDDPPPKRQYVAPSSSRQSSDLDLFSDWWKAPDPEGGFIYKNVPPGGDDVRGDLSGVLGAAAGCQPHE